jgi:hypothetical protein
VQFSWHVFHCVTAKEHAFAASSAKDALVTADSRKPQSTAGILLETPNCDGSHPVFGVTVIRT